MKLKKKTKRIMTWVVIVAIIVSAAFYFVCEIIFIMKNDYEVYSARIVKVEDCRIVGEYYRCHYWAVSDVLNRKFDCEYVSSMKYPYKVNDLIDILYFPDGVGVCDFSNVYSG